MTREQFHMRTTFTPNISKSSGRRSQNRTMIYTAAVALIPALALCACLRIASTPWFLRHDGYPELRSIGYGLTLVHEDCEIVFYGDSSALTAYDPEIVQHMTGMKACNIAENSPVISVAGNYTLDAYLSRNKRPKYLVMMFTPGVFHPTSGWIKGDLPEGVTYLFEFVRGERLRNYILRHPSATLRYATWVGRRLLEDALGRLANANPDDPAKDFGAMRQKRHGIATYPTAAETQCVRTAFHYPASDVHGDAEGVKAARKKYGVEGTQVLINVSPVATCEALQDTFEKVLAGEHDNAFERLPISWFNSQDTHFDATGAAYLSAEAAWQILNRERRSQRGKE